MPDDQKSPFPLENLKFFRDDLYKNHKSKTSLQFLQTSVLHYAICLEIGIGTYSKEYISYEKICYFVPKKLPVGEGMILLFNPIDVDLVFQISELDTFLRK